MKQLVRFVLWVAAILGALYLFLLASDTTYLIRGVRATYMHGSSTASIDDAQFFDLRTIKATRPEAWKLASDFNGKPISEDLRKTLEDTRTVAFLVAKEGELVFEEYWLGYSDSSRSNSFSMAKSIVTMLTQKAIQEGYIESWEDRVSKYVPDIQGAYRADLKLRHLSMMTAGLDWNEHYKDPFDITARAYYGDDIVKTMLDRVPVVIEPGSEFEYQSGAPQLLTMVLSAATGMSVSEYASQTLWKELGAEHDATWHLDHKNGMELGYSSFNSNARDFARFGQLLLNHGRWNGKEVLDSAFIAKASLAGASAYYGWSFWILQDHEEHIYYLRGHLGQYVIVVPSRDLVIVRLGEKSLEQVNRHHREFRHIIEEVLTAY